MAGRGPAPKEPSRKVGHTKDPNPITKMAFVPAEPPDLPDDIEWHPRTVAWWNEIRNSPLAGSMMAVDWSFMLDTALLHTQFWLGEVKLAAEIRLRVAKLGVTPEDRLRLRMQAVAAADGEEKHPGQSARERYAGLRAVPSV